MKLGTFPPRTWTEPQVSKQFTISRIAFQFQVRGNKHILPIFPINKTRREGLWWSPLGETEPPLQCWEAVLKDTDFNSGSRSRKGNSSSSETKYGNLLLFLISSLLCCLIIHHLSNPSQSLAVAIKRGGKSQNSDRGKYYPPFGWITGTENKIGKVTGA